MAHSVNKVILIGNLGKAPELRYTPKGKAVGNLSVATSSRARDAGGHWVEVTQWHRVTVVGDSAVWVAENLKKGRTVYLEGELKYGHYLNKEGVRIPTTEILTFEVRPFGPKREREREGQGQDQLPSDQGQEGSVGDEAPPIAPAEQTHAQWVHDYDRA